MPLSFAMRSALRAISRADRARDAARWARAARLYRKSLRRFPPNPPIWVQYGHALKESGRPAKAESAYRAAISYDPASADARLQLGHVLKIQGRQAEATASYLCAVALGSREPLRELAGLGWPEASLSELQLVADAGQAQIRIDAERQQPHSSVEARSERQRQKLAEVLAQACALDSRVAEMETEIATLRGEISRALASDGVSASVA